MLHRPRHRRYVVVIRVCDVLLHRDFVLVDSRVCVQVSQQQKPALLGTLFRDSMLDWLRSNVDKLDGRELYPLWIEDGVFFSKCSSDAERDMMVSWRPVICWCACLRRSIVRFFFPTTTLILGLCRRGSASWMPSRR